MSPVPQVTFKYIYISAMTGKVAIAPPTALIEADKQAMEGEFEVEHFTVV